MERYQYYCPHSRLHYFSCQAGHRWRPSMCGTNWHQLAHFGYLVKTISCPDEHETYPAWRRLCCDFSHLSLLTETGKISKNNTINITYILEKQIRMEHDIIRTDNPVILQTSPLSFWVGNVAAQGSYHPLILQRSQIPQWQHRM